MKNEELRKVRAAMRDASMAMAQPASDAMRERDYPAAMAWMITSELTHTLYEKASDEELSAMAANMTAPMLLLALTTLLKLPVGDGPNEDEDVDAREPN